MADLTPCPFCGSTDTKLELRKRLTGYRGAGFRAESHTARVVCRHCGAQGAAAKGKVIVGGKTPPPDWATTDEALTARAEAAWNRRENK